MKGWQYIEEYERKTSELADALDECGALIDVWRKGGETTWHTAGIIMDMLREPHHAIWEMHVIDIEFEG